jgi:hypothetical protein
MTTRSQFIGHFRIIMWPPKPAARLTESAAAASSISEIPSPPSSKIASNIQLLI